MQRSNSRAVSSSKLMGMPLPPGDLPVPVAIGLEREGDVLLKPFCPPYYTGPFCTVLAYQAHHVDTDFYDRFYRPEALTQSHRQHPDH